METFRKRQKQMQRMEKQREKAEKRAARKLTRGTLPDEFIPEPEEGIGEDGLPEGAEAGAEAGQEARDAAVNPAAPVPTAHE